MNHDRPTTDDEHATGRHATGGPTIGDELVEPRSIAWRTSPLDRHGLLVMFLTFVGMTGALTLIGLAVVQWWDGSSTGEVDADINRWLEDARTGRVTTIAEYVSQSSDTITKILLGLVLAPVMLWLFRRWHEYAVIFGALVLEVCVFGLSSSLVGRDRPPVEQLDGAPTDSFPSGHIAAATVFFVGLAVVIFMRTTRRGPRAIAVAIGVVMPLGIAWSRLYLGMHYVTDAIAGVVLGLVSLGVTRWAVLRTLPADESPARHDIVAASGSDDTVVRSAA